MVWHPVLTRRVDCVSLTSAIESSPHKDVKVFDLLIVAVEGHELNVIKSLDFSKYSVTVIQVRIACGRVS